MPRPCLSCSVDFTARIGIALPVPNQALFVPCVVDDASVKAMLQQAMPNANFAEWVTPEAVAQTILFLASEAAQAINGAIVPVGG